MFTARETVFWQNSEGFGTTTRTYLDRAISDTLLLRWANLGKYTEETIGLEWYTQLTLFQSLNDAHRPGVAVADRRRDGQRSAAHAALPRA